MLQDGVGYPGARVREMLTLLASFARHPHDVDALLQTVGLTGVAKSSLRKISGGEKQRLALAMALVGRPELVILDEPTAGLDVAARRMTWELVESLRSDGVSVLITTHNMEEAERLADHVVIVDRGRVVAQGSPAALTTGGDGQLHFRADPGLALADVLGSRTWVEESPGHYVVAGPVDPAVVAAVTAWCAQRGVLVSDLRTGARTLEDVFLAVTGRTLP
jgi:ABC-2 type transport system ATP-binding protein